MKRWCDDCVHVQYWTQSTNVPDDFTVCSLGLSLRFSLPRLSLPPVNGHDGGFYRTNCERFTQQGPAYVYDDEPAEIEPCPLCGCVCGVK